MRGWRLFHCADCSTVFWRATRDCGSASTDSCHCGNYCRPIDFKIDLSIEVDQFGNVVVQPEDKCMKAPV